MAITIDEKRGKSAVGLANYNGNYELAAFFIDMAERGIAHTTSECTLRAFSCGSIDPRGSSPAEIPITRDMQLGNRVDASLEAWKLRRFRQIRVRIGTSRTTDG